MFREIYGGINMKAVFLDVDGVLNSEDLFVRHRKEGKSNSADVIELDDVALTYLQKLVQNTGAIIVLSSSWRVGDMNTVHMKNLKRQLSNKGLEIFDCTTTEWQDEFNNRLYRGDQIRIWIDEYNSNHDDKVDKFVILDDECDMGEFINTNLVKTTWKHGMKEEHYLQALKMLS